MKLLVIGGSGRVGSGVIPFLAENHDVTVFDVRPPQVDNVGFIEGSVLDESALVDALGSAEGLIFMAMAPDYSGFELEVQVNVLGVDTALKAAIEAGIKHVVHTSSVSVHDEGRGEFLSEELPLDSRGTYGQTKGMGEMVCMRHCAGKDLSVIALRLYAPSPPERVQEHCDKAKPSGFTTFRDTAAAYDAALRLTDHEGFDAVFISGDHTGTYVNCEKAAQLLGWQVQDRCPNIC
jgi:nucleoside-diphosphate-sugar epimerase